MGILVSSLFHVFPVRYILVFTIDCCLFGRLQPNDETREKQLSTWSELILSYTKSKKIERFVVSELLTTELFHNRAINRSLNQEAALAVLDFMAGNGDSHVM